MEQGCNPSPKFVVCLDKKPRNSKSSSTHTIGGIEFYFKSSQALTGGAIMVCYNQKPYPFVKWIPQVMRKGLWLSQDEMIHKATQWCMENYPEIIKRLKMLDTYIQIQESVWRNNDK